MDGARGYRAHEAILRHRTDFQGRGAGIFHCRRAIFRCSQGEDTQDAANAEAPPCTGETGVAEHADLCSGAAPLAAAAEQLLNGIFLG